MSNTDINLPVAKAASAITAAVVAKTDMADQMALAATSTSNYETWMVINSIPWGVIAGMLAAFYSLLLICEWWWKKLWRPLLERQGWVKPMRRRIITVEQYEAGDSGPAPL